MIYGGSGAGKCLMQEFYSLGHWLGECFIKVNERRPRPFDYPCPSISACYPVTLQMCKSPSLFFSLSLLSLGHTQRRKQDRGVSNKMPVLVCSWDPRGICVFRYVYGSSMSSFKHLRLHIHTHIWQIAVIDSCDLFLSNSTCKSCHPICERVKRQNKEKG